MATMLKTGSPGLGGSETVHVFAEQGFQIVGLDMDMLKSFAIESRRGFELNLEITVKAFLAGYRIAELPSRWKDRSHGESRFRLWAWLPSYLRWYFYAYRPRLAVAKAAVKC